MGDGLAELMFDAHEQERVVRGEFNSSRNKPSFGRPRRWTELLIEEQDQWEAAARVARKVVRASVLGELRSDGIDLQGAR